VKPLRICYLKRFGGWYIFSIHVLPLFTFECAPLRQWMRLETNTEKLLLVHIIQLLRHAVASVVDSGFAIWVTEWIEAGSVRGNNNAAGKCGPVQKFSTTTSRGPFCRRGITFCRHIIII